MKIGIIVASRSEERPFYEVFGQPSNICHPTGNGGFDDVITWEISIDKTIYLMHTGVGEIQAAIGTQFLIDHFNVDKIINYGIVGGLSENHSVKTIGIIEKIVHYDYDITLCEGYVVGQYLNQDSQFIKPYRDAIPAELTCELDRFTCASADKFVGAGEPKKRLRNEFGADICEMESAGIVITCNKNHIPCTLIKAVSDGVDEDEEALKKNTYSASKQCVEYIAKFIQKI